MTTNNFKYAQLQPFTLSGSGAIIGATSLTLTSMTDIDGNALTMSGTFGTKGFGTMEPGNGALEEQISFTGLTNNANGTVTLSGVSSVTFVYPYTETSGLLKTHAGSTTFVISNTAGFYNKVVSKDDDATITATHTYTVPNYPRMDTTTPLPTDQAQLATKAYVDSVVIVGAPNATTSVQGLVQLPTQAQVDAGTATGSTGASLTPTPALLRSKLLSDYVADTGAANAYVITPAPAIAAYATGQIFTFKAVNANTTASTINVNAMGAKSIKKRDGATALIAGDIAAGMIVQIEYDGTNFQMINTAVTSQLPSPTGNAGKFVTTTDGVTPSYGYPYDYQSFTSNGTWTKPSNLVGTEKVIVQLWGGGGSGGGLTASGDARDAGGGGGGAFVQVEFRASDLSATETVTVGATVAGTTGAGTVGNNSSLGSRVVAYGGGGGLIGSNVNSQAGGGGGGTWSVGSAGSGSTGGTGGDPLGGASTIVSLFGGAGGNGARGFYGGGGGGQGSSASTGQAGGQGWFGGGGGGGGSAGSNLVGGAGGAAGLTGYGGAGGAGGGNTGAGTANDGVTGTAPAGGGGGAGSFNFTGTKVGGAGARGEVRVWTFL